MQPIATQDQVLDRMLDRMTPSAPEGGGIAWSRWLLLLLVLGGGLFAWHWFGNSERRQITKAATQFCDAVSKSEISGLGGALGMVQSQDNLSSLLDNEVTIAVEGETEFGLGGTYPQSELKSQIAIVRQRCQRLDLTFSNLNITSIGKKNATFDATARLVVVSDSHKLDEVRRITCTLTKKDGHWCFSKFSERPVLDKGGRPH